MISGGGSCIWLCVHVSVFLSAAIHAYNWTHQSNILSAHLWLCASRRLRVAVIHNVWLLSPLNRSVWAASNQQLLHFGSFCLLWTTVTLALADWQTAAVNHPLQRKDLYALQLLDWMCKCWGEKLKNKCTRFSKIGPFYPWPATYQSLCEPLQCLLFIPLLWCIHMRSCSTPICVQSHLGEICYLLYVQVHSLAKIPNSGCFQLFRHEVFLLFPLFLDSCSDKTRHLLTTQRVLSGHSCNKHEIDQSNL